MPRDTQARTRILKAAAGVLMGHPPERVTLELVARRAGCAKGLIHYHYRTKDAVLAAAAAEIWTLRAAAWQQALAHRDPSTAIQAAWKLIVDETASGVHRAALQLATRHDDLIGRTARTAAAEFRRTVAAATEALVERMGRTLSVPADEAGGLLVSTINGLGLELEMDVDSDRVGAVWAAFWVGLLALTR